MQLGVLGHEQWEECHAGVMRLLSILAPPLVAPGSYGPA